ncbi:uncharacterized protein TNCV_5099971 [Trichonephila clavipes]|uniref:Uncharacterized protein n=1 Tax=Trichonephila clavipes TaxID=2585209 RepID=A0A8X6S522_TRICX|nr:uncharacterized protein TNCV_5099971 [Trichonephila clavipes]
MWNVTDWQKVVFSDESRFVLGTDHNRVRVWRRPGFQEDDEENVETWTACDAENCGFQMLNDGEIVTSVQENSDLVDDEDEENNNESSKGSSNADVLPALETAMEWHKQQSECCPTQLMLPKRIRDFAAKKRRCTIAQRKISDYFPQLRSGLELTVAETIQRMEFLLILIQSSMFGMGRCFKTKAFCYSPRVEEDLNSIP